MAALNLCVRHPFVVVERSCDQHIHAYAIRVVTHSHIIRFSFLLRNVRSTEIQMLNSNFEYKSVNEVDSVDVNVNQCTQTHSHSHAQRKQQKANRKEKRRKTQNPISIVVNVVMVMRIVDRATRKTLQRIHSTEDNVTYLSVRL